MKGWQHLLESFCGTQRSRPLFSSSSSSSSCPKPGVSSQLQAQSIDWSSSDEDESGARHSAAANSSVVLRLDFDAAVQRPNGLSRAAVSRDVSVVQPSEDERPLSPVLRWTPRRIPRSADPFEDTQDEERPKSPIIKTKKRSTPMPSRKRKVSDSNLELKTPEKVQPDPDEPPSPVFTVKRRKGRVSRGRVEIVEVQTQKPAEELASNIAESPEKSASASSEASVINLVESPIIKSQRRPARFSRPAAKRAASASVKEVIQIIDDSQESKEKTETESLPSIECPSSQDLATATKVAAANIQSASSASEARSQSSAQSSDSSKNVEPTLPFDHSQLPRKKPAKNSLLERLQRLKNRQRSQFRMWNHDRQSGKQPKGLVMQILSLKSFGSKRVAHGKFVSTQKSTFLIMDQEQTAKENLRVNDFVKIYPPWQSFGCSTVSAPIIMSMNLFEKVGKPDNHIAFDEPSQCPDLKEFSCQCSLNASIEPNECTTTLHKRGKELLDLLLKPLASSVSSKLRAVEELDSSNQEEESQNQLFTIADAIEAHAKKSTIPLSLRLASQRIFVSRKVKKQELSQSSQPAEEVWIMLGQDANEILCFVELKGDFRSQVKEGSSYLLRGITLAKRLEISRKPDILGLLSAFNSDGKQTLSIYKFATARGSLIEKSVAVQHWIPPVLCKLCFVRKDTNARLCLAMKFLVHEGGRLYCCDSYKVAQSTPYLIVQVRPQAVIPKLILGSAIFLRDLLCSRGEIFADEFTVVHEIDAPSMSIQPDPSAKGPVAEWISSRLQVQKQCLLDLKPIFPLLSKESEDHQLVQVNGTIYEVDEDNSFSWPVCAKCSSEFLQDLPDGAMCCAICRSEGPFNNMVSLSAFVKLSEEHQLIDPSIKILVKLLQETIDILLPGWNENQEYGMEAVLGQEIGPILCKINSRGPTVSLSQVPYGNE